MITTAEIDKAGRIVVPKKLRDDLHLVAGTRLTLQQEGESLIVRPESKPRGLHMKNGLLVYDCGRTFPPDHVDWVEQNRDERAGELYGEWKRD